MAITAECSQCSHTLRVGDQHAGKKIRCPSCKAVVQLPGGSGSNASPAPVSRRPGRPSPGQPDPAPAAQGQQRRRRPRNVPAESAGNEWDENLWSQNLSSYNSPATELPPEEVERRAKSRMAARGGTGGPTDRYYSDDRWAKTETETWTLFLAICGVSAVIGGAGSIVCFFKPSVGIPMMWTGAAPLLLASAIQHWRILAHAWEEDVLCGWMCRLVPFYYLYYVMTRWQENGKPFLKEMIASSAGTACIVVGTILSGMSEAIRNAGP
ncbi:MAG: hypothetical protein KDA96_16045 [Planctomycetaceae bacterium]|nr:hypothetical protein [Planctomycetaceae bacterium]